MVLGYRHDRDADALYVKLAHKPYAYGKDLDEERRVDYSLDDSPIGVEITCVSLGVNIDDLPDAEGIGQILHQIGAPVFA